MHRNSDDNDWGQIKKRFNDINWEEQLNYEDPNKIIKIKRHDISLNLKQSSNQIEYRYY